MREFIGDTQFTMCLSPCNARVVKKSKVCLQYYLNVCALSVKTYKCICQNTSKKSSNGKQQFYGLHCNNIVCDMQNFGMCQFDACQLFTDTLHPYEKKQLIHTNESKCALRHFGADAYVRQLRFRYTSGLTYVRMCIIKLYTCIQILFCLQLQF